MDKTVYIIGAGFSIEAGAPTQERLVEKIFDIHKSESWVFKDDAIKEFKSFLTEVMMVPEPLHNQVPLEDIFTPLDRCLLDNLSYRSLDIDEIKKVRELIYYLIAKTLEHILRSDKKDYIDIFAKHLVKKCSERAGGEYKTIDHLSVLSTNWDILLDTSVQKFIDNDFDSNGVVDYCCHISSYSNDDRVKPGLEMLGLGGFNVKLIKLHGSLNWIQCPRCYRVYVDLDNKIAVNQYTNPKKCRHCKNNFGNLKSHTLTSNLIMPTFLKNFQNPQYKLIWQNAGIELSEANRIVFIGYSLPAADFEMRQLLSRMVKGNAKIEVIDYGIETDTKIIDLKKRFNVFFGSREPQFFFKGAKDYIFNDLH